MAGYSQLGQVLTLQKKAGTSFGTFTTAKSILNPQDVVSLDPNLTQQGALFNSRRLIRGRTHDHVKGG